MPNERNAEMISLYLVLPCLNEEQILEDTAHRLKDKMRVLMQTGQIAPESRVVFVDDGSTDHTWELIAGLHRQDDLFCGIRLTRNFGHQSALLAGILSMRERCDAIITMDADLQDDLDAVDAMLEKLAAGCDIVYGVRSDRRSDTRFKRITAKWFYRGMRRLGASVLEEHADFRLMSRRALDALAQFPERGLFLRGLVPLVGYPSATVSYVRQPRLGGETKFSGRKMRSLALEGVLSMTTRPLGRIFCLGDAIAILGLVALLAALIKLAIGGGGIGAVTLASIWLLGGVQIFAIGVVGLYVGNIQQESKQRPRYLIEEILE
jgi:glycosyltransferase involved in cell wall biosynthesis